MESFTSSPFEGFSHDPCHFRRFCLVIRCMCQAECNQPRASVYPLAAKAVDAFYVDDGVTGADSVEGAIELQRQLQSLFSMAGFLLHKWNSSEPTVLQHIDHARSVHHIIFGSRSRVFEDSGHRLECTFVSRWRPSHHWRM